MSMPGMGAPSGSRMSKVEADKKQEQEVLEMMTVASVSLSLYTLPSAKGEESQIHPNRSMWDRLNDLD